MSEAFDITQVLCPGGTPISFSMKARNRSTKSGFNRLPSEKFPLLD
jgi:hypothetical protein